MTYTCIRLRNSLLILRFNIPHTKTLMCAPFSFAEMNLMSNAICLYNLYILVYKGIDRFKFEGYTHDDF